MLHSSAPRSWTSLNFYCTLAGLFLFTIVAAFNSCTVKIIIVSGLIFERESEKMD
jgi:hypothetical protein